MIKTILASVFVVERREYFENMGKSIFVSDPKKEPNILLLLLIFAMGILIMAGNGMRISAKKR